MKLVLTSGGYYIRFLGHKHPWARKSGYVLEHRYQAMLSMGRLLLPNEVVHHVDHDITNNTMSNLRVMDRTKHIRHHVTIGTWAKNYNACIDCNSTERPHRGNGRCTRCRTYFKKRGISRPVIVIRKPFTGWARSRDRCIRCQKNSHKHLGDGLCSLCYHARRRKTHRANPSYPKTCLVCQKQFLAWHPMAQCCSHRCARILFWKNHPRRLKPKPCEHCGTSFTPKTKRSRFCSHPCWISHATRGSAHRFI